MEWHRRTIAWAIDNQRVVNIAFFVAVLLLGVRTAALLPIEGSERPTDWFAYVLIVPATATLLVRRQRPLIALPVAAAFVIAYWIADYTGAVDGVMWVLFFSATRHGGPNRRRVWQIVGATLAVILLVATIGVIVPTEDLPFIAIIGIFFTHGAAAAGGEALYQRAKYVAELEQRAAALEADLETKAALAAVEERTRLAREMHDIVAHGMSAIVVQAQGAQRLVDRDPARVKDVLRTIETIGRDSSDEMRRMLGVLREDADGPELEPQPGLSDIDALGRHAIDAGVDTTITVVGEPRPLPPGLELTAYRVVQEALTNVVRHAGRPVTATATVTYTDEAVEVEVVDDGLGIAATSDAEGTGHGLLGMRERVQIYNGVVHAGPRVGGGFRVAVSLPVPDRVTT